MIDALLRFFVAIATGAAVGYVTAKIVHWVQSSRIAIDPEKAHPVVRAFVYALPVILAIALLVLVVALIRWIDPTVGGGVDVIRR